MPQPPVEASPGDTAPEEAAARTQVRGVLEAAIDALPGEYRAAFAFAGARCDRMVARVMARL